MNVALAVLAVTARITVAEVEAGRDYWVPSSRPDTLVAANYPFAYEEGGKFLRVDLAKTKTIKWSSRTPGPRLILDAESLIVRMGEACQGGRISVGLSPVWPTSLNRQPADVPTPKLQELTGDWAEETIIDAKSLDRRFAWVVKSVSFKPPPSATNFVARFGGVEIARLGSAANALCFDAETGHRARFFRSEMGEHAAITVGNKATRELTFSATFEARDYFGQRVSLPPIAEQTLKTGETWRRELPNLPGKGLWRITGIFNCEGTVSTQEARVAKLDLNRALTAKRPIGTFRVGIQCHAERYSPAVRRDLLAASQAAGSRIVRGGFATRWSDIEPERGVFDWSIADQLVGEFSAAGLAINTHIKGVPSWAAKLPEAERLAAMGDFAAQLSAHYRGKVDYYEYGNEFDIKKGPSIAECAAILHAIHGPIKAADADARVILGGMACADSTRNAGGKVRKGFHEGIMTAAQGDYDAHAVHVHSPFSEYAPKTDYLVSWRKKLGITAPWYANETAITITTVGEEEAARMVWQKILYAWSRGACDYVWYNDFATIRIDHHRENGYGMLDDEMRPRATYATFSAFQAALADHVFDAIVYHGSQREVLRFRSAADAAKEVVLAGWDRVAASNVVLHVKTDAKAAEACDMMGNRRELPISHGEVVWAINNNPSALILRGASIAEPNAAELAAESALAAKAIVAEMEFRHQPDLLLFGADQVHEIYEAIPQYEYRNWKWAGDLSARVFVARRPGKVLLRIAVEDEFHVAKPNQPTEGDAVLVKLGNRELMLVEGNAAPICEGKPMKGAKLTVTRVKTQTVYDIEVASSRVGAPKWAPYKAIPLNVRIYDADNEGPDCWMEYRPWNLPAAEIR